MSHRLVMSVSRYLWKKGVWGLFSLTFMSIVVLGFAYLFLESELPDVSALNNVVEEIPLRIYTADGKLIEEYGEKRRIPVTYANLPPHLIQALIATEDQRFFEHPGVDILGLSRAAWSVIKTGSKSQGGSTITMQVARNFFLSRKKTWWRKCHEILLAMKIDRELSKEKILELYFNRVYFGNRAYGVGAAANVYFGKPLNKLTLSELALLAGLPQAPSTQNPVVNPAAAKKRRDHVLLRLLEEGYITNEVYTQALHEPMTATYHGSNREVEASFVAEMIRQSLFEHFGHDIYTKGYRVYTTLDSALQRHANHVVTEHILRYDHQHGYRGPVAHFEHTAQAAVPTLTKQLARFPTYDPLIPALILQVGQKDVVAITKFGERAYLTWEGLSWARPALRRGYMGARPTHASQIVKIGDVVYLSQTEHHWQLAQVPRVEGALVSLQPESGAVKALVGGFNFNKSKFNRATQSSRQPGSSFKPFLYAAALNKGYSLASLINDAPIVVDDPSQPNLWRPHNFNLKFNGPMRLKEALVQSKNMVSIRILDDLGIEEAIDFATRFGFKRAQLPHALSLALGTLSVSPLELTAAYAIFANGGYRVEPYFIQRITDQNGKVLLKANPPLANATSHDTQAPRVIPQDIAFLMNTAMKDVIQRGTARAANSLNRHDLAGKTGTTNDQVDAWFAGFNPDLVTITWMGYDVPETLHAYGATLALPLWIDFMREALAHQPEHNMAQPATVVAVPINPKTGQLAQDNEQDAIMEFFRDNEVPTKPVIATADIAPVETLPEVGSVEPSYETP